MGDEDKSPDRRNILELIEIFNICLDSLEKCPADLRLRGIETDFLRNRCALDHVLETLHRRLEVSFVLERQ